MSSSLENVCYALLTSTSFDEVILGKARAIIALSPKHPSMLLRTLLSMVQLRANYLDSKSLPVLLRYVQQLLTNKDVEKSVLCQWHLVYIDLLLNSTIISLVHSLTTQVKELSLSLPEFYTLTLDCYIHDPCDRLLSLLQRIANLHPDHLYTYLVSHVNHGNLAVTIELLLKLDCLSDSMDVLVDSGLWKVLIQSTLAYINIPASTLSKSLTLTSMIIRYLAMNHGNDRDFELGGVTSNLMFQLLLHGLLEDTYNEAIGEFVARTAAELLFHELYRCFAFDLVTFLRTECQRHRELPGLLNPIMRDLRFNPAMIVSCELDVVVDPRISFTVSGSPNIPGAEGVLDQVNRTKGELQPQNLTCRLTTLHIFDQFLLKQCMAQLSRYESQQEVVLEASREAELDNIKHALSRAQAAADKCIVDSRAHRKENLARIAEISRALANTQQDLANARAETAAAEADAAEARRQTREIQMQSLRCQEQLDAALTKAEELSRRDFSEGRTGLLLTQAQTRAHMLESRYSTFAAGIEQRTRESLRLHAQNQQVQLGNAAITEAVLRDQNLIANERARAQELLASEADAKVSSVYATMETQQESFRKQQETLQQKYMALRKINADLVVRLTKLGLTDALGNELLLPNT